MADRDQDALDRYWDDLVQGRLSSREALDPPLAGAVRGFHAAPDVDGPRPVFVARLREELMPTTARLSPALHAPVAGAANGRVPWAQTPVPTPAAGRRPAWIPHMLAAVIAIALGLGGWVISSYERNPGRLGGIPAVVVGSTPFPQGVTDAETLVEVVMPAGIIAAGTRTDLALMLDSIPSGTVRKTGLDQTGCCAGLNVNVVLTGTATARADGPMQLIPKGGSLEPVTITAGSDVVIGPGDTLVYRQETEWEWTVAEGGALSFLWGVAYGGIFSPSVNVGFGHPEDSDVLRNVPIPADGYPIRIWRATLEPGATIRPEPGVSLLMVADPAADARIGEQSGNAFKNLGTEPVSLYLMSVGSASLDGAPSAAGLRPIMAVRPPGDVGTVASTTARQPPDSGPDRTRGTLVV